MPTLKSLDWANPCFGRFETGKAKVAAALRERPDLKLHQFTRRLKGRLWGGWQ